MTDQDVMDRVRELRGRGSSPKEIARFLGLPPAQVTSLVRTIAAQAAPAAGAEDELLGCWVTPGWRSGLTVKGHPDWPDGIGGSTSEGLVQILVAQSRPRGRVSACGYLVDTFCLGVKDVLGPRSLPDLDALDGFREFYFQACDGVPIAAPLELVQHLVFGAIAYARSLGFEPPRDFAGVAGHLGRWSGHSDITFGRDGKPFYVQGPHDNAKQIMRTLSRTRAPGSYDLLIVA